MNINALHSLCRVAVAITVSMAAISCTTTPASVTRTEKVNECDCDLPSQSLGDLLELAIIQPQSADSAHALAHFVEEWQIRQGDDDQGEISSTGGRRYKVSFNGAHQGLPLTYFDELSPAVDYRLKRLAHHRRDGTGAPLVALRENRQQEAIEAYYPPEAITRAITAVARKGTTAKGVQQVHIDLLCPLQNDEVTVDGETLPLAADFSVPWAALLERSGSLSLSRYGDFGIGTFNGLDGEMIAFDGAIWQVKSDGKAYRVNPATAKTPFRCTRW